LFFSFAIRSQTKQMAGLMGHPVSGQRPRSRPEVRPTKYLFSLGVAGDGRICAWLGGKKWLQGYEE
jgi:hypothetical protein